jgi:hypothetical protein
MRRGRGERRWEERGRVRVCNARLRNDTHSHATHTLSWPTAAPVRLYSTVLREWALRLEAGAKHHAYAIYIVTSQSTGVFL